MLRQQLELDQTTLIASTMSASKSIWIKRQDAGGFRRVAVDFLNK